MSLLRKLVPAERRGSTGPFSTGPFTDGTIPPNSWSVNSGGQSITPTVALQNSAVWSCVRILSDVVATMPCNGFRKAADDIPLMVTPPPALLVKPAAMGTFSEWIYQGMVSLLLRGNAYGIIVARNAQAWPTQVEIQNPDYVKLKQDDSGQLYYEVRARNSPKAKRVDPSEMMHVRRWLMPGEICGLSPIRFAATNIQLGLGATEFGADFFAGGGHPTSILATAADINETQARAISARFMEKLRGGRGPVTLGHGLEYKQIQVAPDESQFLATSRANVADIARYFGVPPEMIGGEAGNSMTYANVEQRSLDFLTYAVHPWLKVWEDAITALTPAPQYVRFDTSSLLRTDLKTRYQANALALQNGFLSPNEVRKDENRPPISGTDGDEFNWPPTKVATEPVNGADV